MRIASARSVGTSHYFETLEKMESELMRMRDAYERELERMRRELQEANTQSQRINQVLHSDRDKGFNAYMK